jgi:hypothetical protein
MGEAGSAATAVPPSTLLLPQFSPLLNFLLLLHTRELVGQVAEVKYRSGSSEEVHPKNPIDFEPVVHASDLNFKPVEGTIRNRQLVNPPGKPEFAAPNASDSVEDVLREGR